MPRACVLLSASRSPNRRVFRRSQILALGTAYFLIYRLGSSLRPPRVRAEELRRTHFDLVFHGRPALSLRACMAPDQTVLCQLRPGAPSNPSIFQRYPCSHYGRLRVVQPFRAPALQTAHALCARNSFEYIAQTTSVQALPGLRPGALTHNPRAANSAKKAFGPPPLPGRWPSDPYRPVTGLRKCPLRSCPAGCASLIEVSNHRWTFTALLRERRKARTPSIEQSAFQTSLPPNPCKSVVPPARPTQNRRNYRLPLRFSEGSKP